MSPAYQATCPVCGGTYTNYTSAARTWCSVACQFAPLDPRPATVTPGACGGEPCFAGTRIPVRLVVSRLVLGHDVDELLADYPALCLADLELAATYLPSGGAL